MNFHDLKLPKEYSKKKKLDLYKCWILSPLSKGSDQRILDLDWGCDRYGLSEKGAVAIEINKLFPNYRSENFDEIVEAFSKMCFVIMRVTLLAGVMDEEIIIPPENSEGFDTDPHYDPINEVLNVTIHHRVADSEIKNYALNGIKLKVDENTGIIVVQELDLNEQIINHSVTGGK